MMFSVLALFVGHAGLGLGDLQTPLPIVLSWSSRAPWCWGTVPPKVSFLTGMRHYAGNWHTTSGASSRQQSRRSPAASSR